MPDYTKMRNDELIALLKARALPTSGKKAEMAERLTKDDENKATDSKKPSGPVANAQEDEIDWDEDEVPSATTNANKDAGATVSQAIGEDHAVDSEAAPSKVADIDSAETGDLSVAKPEEDAAVPKRDYTSGLAATNIDDEIEKRKKRAAKFGLNIDADETLKKLERAKKFGEVGPPRGLDEALPERSLKRGRESNDQGGRGRDKRRGGHNNGRRARGQGGRNQDNGTARREEKPRANHAGGGGSWMSDADKVAAERRRQRFAA